MDLEFSISKNLLFIAGLLQKPDIEGWVALQDDLWSQYNLGYRLLQGNCYKFFLESEYKKEFEQSIEEVDGLLKKGMTSTEFSILLKNAQDHKKWLEETWQENKNLIIKELSDILRIDMPEEKKVVYTFGSLLHIGRNINGKILWGQYEHWPNYSLVYLVHEYLHGLFGHTKIEHAIIELISDNEMRIRLNKGGTYFKCEGENVGHESLIPVEKAILGDWKLYLDDKSFDIHQFVKSMQEKYPQHSEVEDA